MGKIVEITFKPFMRLIFQFLRLLKKLDSITQYYPNFSDKYFAELLRESFFTFL